MANLINGHVAKIGETGSLVTDIAVDLLADAPRDETVTIKFGDFETVGLFETGHDQPDSTMVAVLGENGVVEIEIVGISLAEMLGIKIGEPVSIKW